MLQLTPVKQRTDCRFHMVSPFQGTLVISVHRISGETALAKSFLKDSLSDDGTSEHLVQRAYQRYVEN